jgi:hypothetical protein
MSGNSSIAYRLRQNKAVDRELFFSLLAHLGGVVPLSNYRYCGLGGPFMEDFRAIHSRLGIIDMLCYETNSDVHSRQQYNRPVPFIRCIHNAVESYIDESIDEKPSIVWLDYTDPASLSSQVDAFCRLAAAIAPLSILRITVNASPLALGTPPNGTAGPELQEWRLQRLRERVGDWLPHDTQAADLTTKKFGPLLLRILDKALGLRLREHPQRRVVTALSTHYADGQPMVTHTVVVVDAGSSLLSTLEQSVGGWTYASSSASPHVIDLPFLSTLERLRLEAVEDPRKELTFSLPKSLTLATDPIESFSRFYRIFPHFSRIDL